MAWRAPFSKTTTERMPLMAGGVCRQDGQTAALFVERPHTGHIGGTTRGQSSRQVSHKRVPAWWQMTQWDGNTRFSRFRPVWRNRVTTDNRPQHPCQPAIVPAVIRQLIADGGASALDAPHRQFKKPGAFWYDLPTDRGRSRSVTGIGSWRVPAHCHIVPNTPESLTTNTAGPSSTT